MILCTMTNVLDNVDEKRYIDTARTLAFVGLHPTQSTKIIAIRAVRAFAFYHNYTNDCPGPLLLATLNGAKKFVESCMK